MEVTKEKRIAINKAIKYAESVLVYFEKKYPKDKRPRKAIKTAKEWKKGKITFQQIRKASLSAHAAARKAKNLPARYAARTAGQAVATAHAKNHYLGARYYMIKARKAKRKELM